MSRGAHFNRAGRRSGGPPAFHINVPATTREERERMLALEQLREVMRATGATPGELVAGAIKTGHMNPDDATAVEKWLMENP